MQAANSIFEPASHVPLYVQLRDHLRDRIATGNLRSGDRLAPTRSFARELGVHRATVEAAYAELESEGLLIGHVGRGTFVAGRPQPETQGQGNRIAAAPATETGSFPWQGFFPFGIADDPLEPLMRAAGDPGVISFATAHPPSDVLPLTEFRRACERVLHEQGRAALRPGPAGGYPPLIEWLGEYLGKQGIGGEVTITNGIQQGLDLLAKIFVAPGQSVVIENPVYPGALLPFRQAGARILALPMTADGPDLRALETMLESQRVRLILVTPNFQNPTGATMSTEARQRLIEIARRNQTPLVENDAYGALGFSGKALPALKAPSLKAMDRAGGVIYLGSLSKAGFPGLRLGWCVAPTEVSARLRRAKRATDLHTDQFTQAVIVEFARRGGLDRGVKAVRAACKAKAATLAREVSKHFPPEVVWRVPQGGISAWFRLPAGVSADAVLARAREHGVVFTPGRFFYFQDARPETFRLSFGAVNRTEIVRGVKVLGEAIRAEMRRPRRITAQANSGLSLV